MTSRGTLIQQTIEIPYDNTESCGILELRTCHHRGVTIQPRGFNAAEIAIIEHALLRASRESLKRDFSHPPAVNSTMTNVATIKSIPITPIMALSSNTPVSLIDTTYKEEEKRQMQKASTCFQEVMAEMKGKVDWVRSTLLESLHTSSSDTSIRLRRAYSDFEDKGLVGIYENVSVIDVPLFLQGIIHFPVVESEIHDFLISGAMNMEWHSFHVSFSIQYENQGGVRELLLMAAATDSSQNSFNWLIFDSTIHFAKATDLIVVRHCEKTFIFGRDCSTHLLRSSASITMNEILQLQQMAWIIAVERLAELIPVSSASSASVYPPFSSFSTSLPTALSIPTLTTSSISSMKVVNNNEQSNNDNKQLNRNQNLDNQDNQELQVGDKIPALALVQAIAKTWKEVVSAFKTTLRHELIGTIKGQGFSKLLADCTYTRVSINHLHLEAWIGHILSVIPQSAQRINLNMSIHESIQFTIPMVWINHQIMFEHVLDSSFTVYDIFINVDPNGLMSHWLIMMNSASSVKWAPNLLLYRESKSVAGGIFQSTRDVLRPQDVTISLDDIFALFDFFRLLGQYTVARNVADTSFRFDLPVLDP